MRRVGTGTSFALLYLVMTGALTAADFVVGVVLGIAIAVVAGLGRADPEPWNLGRAAGVPLFVAGLAVELLRGSWMMLRVLLGAKSWRNVGFVEVPLEARSEQGAVVSGLAATVTPGSVAVEIDRERRTMLMNVIDARDPEGTRESLTHFYERYQKPLLP